MNLNELDNKELLFVYFTNKFIYDLYERVLETRKYESVVEIFDMGSIVINNVLYDEEIDEIRGSKHYDCVVSLHQKLEPIASIIGDVDQELYNSIEEIVNYRYKF